jgi:hypothetical protein
VPLSSPGKCTRTWTSVVRMMPLYVMISSSEPLGLTLRHSVWPFLLPRRFLRRMLPVPCRPTDASAGSCRDAVPVWVPLAVRPVAVALEPPAPVK